MTRGALGMTHDAIRSTHQGLLDLVDDRLDTSRTARAALKFANRHGARSGELDIRWVLAHRREEAVLDLKVLQSYMRRESLATFIT